MSPFKDFQITYDALNEAGTFSEGDTITGTVSFHLNEDTRVKSVLVKVKGEARVHWREGSGDDRKTRSAHRRYFKVKEYLVVEHAEKGNELREGFHSFKFRLTIPHGDMPSSFKGLHGSIDYKLEAKISRSHRLPSIVQKEFSFVSKSLPCSGQVMCPQSGSVRKEAGGFSSGEVQMSATVDRKYCSPGETFSVSATICNSSSRTMKPKFKLEQVTVFSAEGHTNRCCRTLFKMVEDKISGKSEETVCCKVTIPLDAMYTLHNCEIISVEYHIKVYLDISFAIDPEVVFPLVIGPKISAACEDVGPYQAGTFGAPSYGDFPVPTFTGFSPVPPSSGYPAALVPTPLAGTSGYNQWPQNTTPYGFPAAAFMPPSAQHPATGVPAQYQQDEQHPSYTHLYPTVDKTGYRT